jgi:hypothetical protein
MRIGSVTKRIGGVKRRIWLCNNKSDDVILLNYKNCAGIFKQSMGARNRVRNRVDMPAKQHSLAELVPWNQF